MAKIAILNLVKPLNLRPKFRTLVRPTWTSNYAPIGLELNHHNTAYHTILTDVDIQEQMWGGAVIQVSMRGAISDVIWYLWVHLSF